jgi:hypothetical protein
MAAQDIDAMVTLHEGVAVNMALSRMGARHGASLVGVYSPCAPNEPVQSTSHPKPRNLMNYPNCNAS